MNIKRNTKPLELLLQARIESKIFLIQGKRVMLDKDLAELYEVPTKRLNEQVKRNFKRFPSDFMFQLTRGEFKNLKSHFATSSWGGVRKLPLVFTEQGVAMLSSVLNSERAIEVNIRIVRTFIKLREILLTHSELREKIELLEKEHNGKFFKIFLVISQLNKKLYWLLEEKKTKGEIGFKMMSGKEKIKM